MILKSALRESLNEVLADHDIEDADLTDDLLDRLGSTLEVMDDDDEQEGRE